VPSRSGADYGARPPKSWYKEQYAYGFSFPAMPKTDGKQKEHGRPRRPKHVHEFLAEECASIWVCVGQGYQIASDLAGVSLHSMWFKVLVAKFKLLTGLRAYFPRDLFIRPR